MKNSKGAYFPMFVDIEGKEGLVIGGGRTALGKVRRLLPWGPCLRVVAPEFCPEFTVLSEEAGNAPAAQLPVLIRRAFSPEDIREDLAFVIAATDRPEVNHLAASLCREKRIPVNVVDVPEECTFLFPSLVKRGRLAVGISTGGASPSAAVSLKQEIGRILPDRIGEILDWMAERRGPVKEALEDGALRKEAYQKLFAASMEQGRPLTGAEEEEILKKVKTGEPAGGFVSLVGAGCGGADWLTRKGMRCLADADTVLYDELVSEEILDLIPAEAERIPVGKRGGAVSPKQDTITLQMIRLASEGRRVVRLKGGDPFVFGRGGEEAMALRAAGIPFEVVPGITSPIAIPEEAGIPVTHRGLSRSLHIVTAHTAERELPEQMDLLAAMDGTLVFLMGLRVLERLCGELIRLGKDPETPAAVISGGSSRNPGEVRGSLRDLPELTRKAGIQAPAVIVVGRTAALDVRSGGTAVPPDGGGTAERPAEGRRAGRSAAVGLMGTGEFRRKLAGLLEQKGVETISLLEGTCRDLPAELPWEQFAAGRPWILFTSGRGVDSFFRKLRAERRDLRRLSGCRFGVIGRATEKKLEEHGLIADYCPETYTGKALAEGLCGSLLPSDEVYLLDSAKGSGEVQEVFREHGVRCARISLYDTEYRLSESAAGRTFSALLFGSAGAVRALRDSGYVPGEDTEAYCIGPVCAEAYRECFGKTPRVPGEISAEALVQCYFSGA